MGYQALTSNQAKPTQDQAQTALKYVMQVYQHPYARPYAGYLSAIGWAGWMVQVIWPVSLA